MLQDSSRNPFVDKTDMKQITVQSTAIMPASLCIITREISEQAQASFEMTQPLAPYRCAESGICMVQFVLITLSHNLSTSDTSTNSACSVLRNIGAQA